MSDRKGFRDFVKAEGDLGRGVFLAAKSIFWELGQQIRIFYKTQITNYNERKKSCGKK